MASGIQLCDDAQPTLMFFINRVILVWITALSVSHTFAGVGIFDDHSDIGALPASGKTGVQWDGNSYKVSGSGANMWFTNDALHFVWKKVSGDVSLSADVMVHVTEGNDPHRKGVLMVRQSLDADSAYADAALHGDGLTSLQYRESRGARTYEIQANRSGLNRLRIEKRGKYVSMSTAGAGEDLRAAGGSFRLELSDPFYVGIGVCAHNSNRVESATFRNVALNEIEGAGLGTNLMSTLETITIASKDRRVVFTTTNRIEAPNWMRDGTNLLFNGRGRIFRVPISGGEPVAVDSGFAIRCNNDHGISPDGTMLVISDQSQEKGQSLIYTLPVVGGIPKRVTMKGPSYWHGWSPDGRTLAYCAERGGEYDIYTIPVDGGEEKRLTTATGLDDGPDYTADGKWIYYNSMRSGGMQVWRMHPDGTAQEQVTMDEFNNWFPHPSPDGKWLVFLSYEPSVTGHPADKDVTLRIMPLGGGKVEVLAKLFGGQGTINVPSWSPDSKRLSFVSYQRR